MFLIFARGVMKYFASGSLIFLLSAWTGTNWAEEPPLGLPPVPIPADNPQTPEKIALGKSLFRDKRLSGDGTISCSSCHNPDMAFSDGQAVSQGINGSKSTRNSPTLLNAAYYTTQFWDGRRPSLEAQALDPFVNAVEHGLKDHTAVLEIVRSDAVYPTQFESAFGIDASDITIEHVTKGIASFERTLVSGDSPFDRYMYGGDQAALSPEAERGLRIFRSKAQCSLCHTIGPDYATFTDNKFHNLGVGFSEVEPRMYQIINHFRAAVARGETVDELVLQGTDVSQLGRVLVTITPTDLDTHAIGGFKTPTLRNIALTAPYMHDGSIQTLEEVVELYDRGNKDNLRLDPLFKPLNLTEQEKSDLVAFMKSLTSSDILTPQASTD